MPKKNLNIILVNFGTFKIYIGYVSRPHTEVGGMAPGQTKLDPPYNNQDFQILIRINWTTYIISPARSGQLGHHNTSQKWSAMGRLTCCIDTHQRVNSETASAELPRKCGQHEMRTPCGKSLQPLKLNPAKRFFPLVVYVSWKYYYMVRS